MPGRTKMASTGWRAAIAAACEPPSREISGRDEVLAAVEHHRRSGAWRLPAFATNFDRRLFKRLRAVLELVDALPEEAAALMLGEQAATQASPAECKRLVVLAIEAKSGPEGGEAAKAARSLRLLRSWAHERSLAACGLPAGRAMIASIVLAEATRAQSASAGGSRGGKTVGRTIQEGFLALQKVARLPIEADDPLVDAAARFDAGGGDSSGTEISQAGSLPLGVQCQLEWLASRPEWSVARVTARSFLCGPFANACRLNDGLNARLWLGADGSIEGTTTVRSKDGVPLRLHAPAEGFLGPWGWLPEHMREMQSRPHCLGNFSASLPSQSKAMVPGVLPPGKCLPALRDLCAMAPLRMSAASFKAAGITFHSPHGTAADLVRFMGAAKGFGGTDARAAGHWLRDRRAPQELPPAGAARATGHGVPVGAPNARGDMERRYTSGPGRRGERHEQLDVRSRLVRAVAGALQKAKCFWWELPPTLESWDVLI